MDKIKVLIIDEQAIFRTGIRYILSEDDTFDILECDLSSDPLSIIETNLPDIVLIGTRLTEQNWLELGKRITRYYPNTKVVMLTPDPNDEVIFEVIKTGAIACVNKNVLGGDLVNTLRLAINGKYPINEVLTTRPMLAKHVLTQFQEMASKAKLPDLLITPLTNREIQILNYVANGNTNKQIALLLQISEQTIKNHVSAILRKLNANDRAHAVLKAINQGLISVE